MMKENVFIKDAKVNGQLTPHLKLHQINNNNNTPIKLKILVGASALLIKSLYYSMSLSLPDIQKIGKIMFSNIKDRSENFER